MKYSIIIPSFNGLDYLTSCIESIFFHKYSNYEIIVSDDNSTDGTSEYLNGLKYENLKILKTPHRMSMTEHWEWALSHAEGEWCIFVGQDDGLQPYFFELSDILTDYALKINCRTITSERAYYFWPNCDHVYGNAHVSYTAIPLVMRKSTVLSAFQALTGVFFYFNLPQMYTTSLFHRSILDEARAKQGGRVFVTHPQDANLAAIACSLDRYYIKSLVPLGWVGTSPKSAGMAITSPSRDSANLRNIYLEKIRSSPLAYCSLIGEFSLDSAILYFWGALLQTKTLRGALINRVLHSKLFKYIIFCAAYNTTDTNQTDKRNDILTTATNNGCSTWILMGINLFYKFLIKLMHSYQMCLNFLQKKKLSCVFLYLEQDNFVSMKRASKQVLTRIHKKKFLDILRQFVYKTSA